MDWTIYRAAWSQLKKLHICRVQRYPISGDGGHLKQKIPPHGFFTFYQSVKMGTRVTFLQLSGCFYGLNPNAPCVTGLLGASTYMCKSTNYSLSPFGLFTGWTSVTASLSLKASVMSSAVVWVMSSATSAATLILPGLKTRKPACSDTEKQDEKVRNTPATYKMKAATLLCYEWF